MFEYYYKADAKRALCLEMIGELGGAQFQILGVRYRAFDQMLELHAILLEPGDDEAAVISGFRDEPPGAIVSWVEYGSWPEYADQVR